MDPGAEAWSRAKAATQAKRVVDAIRAGEPPSGDDGKVVAGEAGGGPGSCALRQRCATVPQESQFQSERGGRLGQGSKRSLYVVGVLVLAAATLELGTRLLAEPQGARSISRETSQGSDEFDQFQRDVSQCADLGVEYYEYFLFSAAPCATATVNVSDFYSSRATPASQPADHADLIVWTFGGSTMQEFETTDARSIANVIARTMAAAGVGARVENFGAPTFRARSSWSNS